ncbi:MAG TPA: ATP-binding cassette domain-containing protein [Solirubrobacterales bacterium]|nr:ATP-binding cassette domain-containing protein [Solirubrobacterales bacterium]
MSQIDDSGRSEEPINSPGEQVEESPEVEAAVSDVGGSSELAGEVEAADEAAAADDGIDEAAVAEDIQREEERNTGVALSDATGPDAKVVNEPEPSSGGEYVASDGAVLFKDFVLPGVHPGDHDPYKWHTGEKIDHGGTDAIEIKGLTKQFGRTRILNGLDLGLPDDQISMVLGPSGTGKSVLIKHIVGLLYPDSGDVVVKGQSVPDLSDDDLFEMRKKFGLLFQDGALFGSMNIFDNVAFPLRQHTDKGEEEIEDICTRRLREVGLGEAHYKMPNELSGGMRKRAGFARALVLDPEIVMFDEPDSGLDPVRTALLCELIKEVHAESGGCYMVISHDLGTARRIADFIAVLWKGKIVESGPKERLFESENQFVHQFLRADVTGPLAMD